MKTRIGNTLDVQEVQCHDKAVGDHMETRLLVPIRVLYTINASPQFLLARQRRKVEVVPIAWRTDDNAQASAPELAGSTVRCHKFARIPLKICLGAVCTSSPELLADRTRDYSVYVLDPLESTSTGNNQAASNSESFPIQSRTSDNTPSSCLPREGVSIGMGLMSWCMADNRVACPGVGDDDDDGCVTGKLVMDRGTDALEVVIYLRETALQSQQQHALSMSFLGFYPSSTASPTEYSSVGNAQCILSVPSSPAIHVSSSLPESSQSSVTGCNPCGEYTSECGETSMPEMASTSTSEQTPRVGRPPGSTTNPEKRARRLAIQSHKEMLERMENIAKMQQGREHDKTLIRISDHDIPPVTDEEIARQRKILQDLESRPLIVDKSCLLTTKPLPKRPKGSTSIVPLSRGSLPKRNLRSDSTTTNATASGSRVSSNDVVSKKRSSDVSTISAIENKHGSQLLLSLLTSVLGKVDGSYITQPNSMPSRKGKGKGKEPTDDALADVLKQLLPLIPNAAVQTSSVSALRTPPPTNTIPTSVPLPGPTIDQWNDFRSQGTLPLSKPPSLFKTAAETFYDSQSDPNGLYDQHWAASAREQPKVREDAHPVPGGGWARGRNLIPRTTTPTQIKPLPPNGQAECVASDAEKSTTTCPAQAQPDKENTPPMKTGRGLKRTLSIAGPHKANDKKRKQNSSPAVGNNEPRAEKRTPMGLTAKNKTNISGASGPPVAASSPFRSTASVRAARSLPVMAMSEPDYLSPRPPIVATSTFPDLIREPPRTPPRHETSLGDNAGDSLFTPCAPNDEVGSLLRGGTHHSVSKLLSSPSATRKKSHVGHVSGNPSVQGESQECQRTESESLSIKTGWDLPPSSPPPPTSPISPQAEIVLERDENMDLESTLQLQTGLVEMEKGTTDGKFEDWGTTIKSDGASTPVAEPFQIQDSSDFDMLTDTDFDFSLLSQAQESIEGVGVELDIEELWKSLGPVIAQAQSDSSVPPDSQTSSSQGEADFSYFDLDDQTDVETGGIQSGVDATKLAEDLKALFGGCVV